MTKYGYVRSDRTCPEFASWRAMRHRCNSPKNPSWKNYGGRGIRVCDAWNTSYETFLADMGPRPGPGYSLDRIDSDGHYEPGNVRWATDKQQGRNQKRRMTEQQARCAKLLLAQRFPTSVIAEAVGSTKAAINFLRRGETWNESAPKRPHRRRAR